MSVPQAAVNHGQQRSTTVARPRLTWRAHYLVRPDAPDKDEVPGSSPGRPTTPPLTSGNAGHLAVWRPRTRSHNALRPRYAACRAVVTRDPLSLVRSFH